MANPVSPIQLEAALAHARAHPRWKNYVDADVPAKEPPKKAEKGGFLLGASIGGFTAYHLLHKGYVLRTPHYMHSGIDLKPEGWALRPKPRVNPTVFVCALALVGGFIGRSYAGSVKANRQKEWARLGLVPAPTPAAGH